jgi:hypothetical protein
VGTDPGIGWLLARTSDRGDAVTLVSEKDPYIRSYVLFSPISVSLRHLCHQVRRRKARFVPRRLSSISSAKSPAKTLQPN